MINTLGKLPPQAIDAEESLLGSLMNYETALINVIDFLKPEYFYVHKHSIIYNAILALYEKNDPVDEQTVSIQLRKTNKLEEVGGIFSILELSKGTRNNWDFNSKVIYEKYLARETIRISVESLNIAYNEDTDIFNLIEVNQMQMLALTNNKSAKQARPINELVSDCRRDYHIKVENGITGIPCGLDAVDSLTHGWQKGNLIIIAARPAMGKTAFVLQCAKYPAIKLDKPVVVFSLEMSDLELTNRMISGESDIHIEKLLTHNLSEADYLQIESSIGPLNDAPIIIDDTASLNIFEFRAKCRRLKAQHDIQLIIVDYLQLMSGKQDGKGNNREQEISSISRALKSVAKELNVPVIALSQLSRAVESRPGGQKKPMLSDLRESGSIEQDADMVLFLYRDEYYGITVDKANQSTVGRCDVIIAKNRNGKCATAATDFNGAKMRFKNWENSNPNALLSQPDTGFAIKQSSLEFNSQEEDEELPF